MRWTRVPQNWARPTVGNGLGLSGHLTTGLSPDFVDSRNPRPLGGARIRLRMSSSACWTTSAPSSRNYGRNCVNAVVILRLCRYPQRMATQHPSEPADRFTREQLVELRVSFDRAEAVRGLPLLPEWYRNLPVIGVYASEFEQPTQRHEHAFHCSRALLKH